jgi:hypothetical protein
LAGAEKTNLNDISPRIFKAYTIRALGKEEKPERKYLKMHR